MGLCRFCIWSFCYFLRFSGYFVSLVCFSLWLYAVIRKFFHFGYKCFLRFSHVLLFRKFLRLGCDLVLFFYCVLIVIMVVVLATFFTCCYRRSWFFFTIYRDSIFYCFNIVPFFFLLLLLIMQR